MLARRQRLGVLSLPFPCGDHVCLFTRKSVHTFYKWEGTHVERVKVLPGTHVPFYTLGGSLLAKTSVCSCMWGEALGACTGRRDRLFRDHPQCPVASIDKAHVAAVPQVSLHRSFAENGRQTDAQSKTSYSNALRWSPSVAVRMVVLSRSSVVPVCIYTGKSV